MSLADLAALYLVAGLACAVAIYRASPGGARALAAAALAVLIWPLWAPIALTSRRGDHQGRPPSGEASAPAGPPSPVAETAARIDAALRDAASACAGAPIEAILPRAAVARISAEVTRAAERHAELSALLGTEGFDLAAAEARLADLTRADAPPRALTTARLHLDNVRRLSALRDRDALALAELSDLVSALRAQLALARFAGSQAEGAGGIVAEMWARVEGLGAALGAEDELEGCAEVA